MCWNSFDISFLFVYDCVYFGLIMVAKIKTACIGRGGGGLLLALPASLRKSLRQM